MMNKLVSKEYLEREYHLAVLDFKTACNEEEQWEARKTMARLELIAMQEYGFDYSDELHRKELGNAMEAAHGQMKRKNEDMERNWIMSMDHMMKEEFMKYVADAMKERFENADVQLEKITKQNDEVLHGIVIREEGERIAPCIYLDSAYEAYREGIDAGEIVRRIADKREELGNRDEKMPIVQKFCKDILDYNRVKNKLSIRLCDREENKEYLKEAVHTEHGDFSAEYRIILESGHEGEMSMSVTPELMESWGISTEQLHVDALHAETREVAVLGSLDDMAEEIITGEKSENLLAPENSGKNYPQLPMYCLTNETKLNGASVILQEEILERVGEIVGDDYYILPSSKHEVMIVPENSMMSAKELSAIVREINENELERADFLSNHVQHYDRQTGIMENALKREARIHQEQMKKDPIKEVMRRSAQSRPIPAKRKDFER